MSDQQTGATLIACDDHTYGPSGYVAWHEWVERMMETHDPSLCSGCGFWMIWVPRQTASTEALDAGSNDAS